MAGNVVYAVCQWGIVASLAKIGSTEMVGQYALSLAIATPIAMFFQFQLRGVQATDAEESFHFSEYLTLRLITTTFAVVITFLIIELSGVAAGVATVVMLVATDRALSAITDVFYGALQRRERMDIIARATMVNGAFSLTLAVAGVWATGSLAIGMLGSIVGTALPFLFYIFPKERAVMRSIGESWLSRDSFRLRSLFALVFPLGIVMLLISLTANIPRYIIEDNQGTEELGIYAALSLVVTTGVVVVGALGQSASPRLATYFAAGNYTAFWSLSRRMIVSGAMLGLTGLVLAHLFGARMLAALYTPEYGEYVGVLEALALAASVIFAASFAGYCLTAARKFAIQAPLFGVVALVCLASSFLLIPRYGIEGAAWATVITGATQLVLLLFALRRATSPLLEMGTNGG